MVAIFRLPSGCGTLIRRNNSSIIEDDTESFYLNEESGAIQALAGYADGPEVPCGWRSPDYRDSGTAAICKRCMQKAGIIW